MAREDYHSARVQGRRAYRADVQAGRYPYLPALDDMISFSETQGEYPLGRVDIPLNLIVGTKTAGRQKAFASNFMPLLGETTEFGMKWATLYDSQLNEGIRDPIKVYEFMNKFYVEEGNKRVSVMKAVDAAYIPANVIRILPKRTEEKDNLIYYEFVDFYSAAQTNEIWFSQVGSFPALIQAIGKKPGEPWDIEFRRNFFSLYNTFSEYFLAKGGEKLPVTTADAFLKYLEIYDYEDILKKAPAEIKEDVNRLWDEFSITGEGEGSALVKDTEDAPASSKGLLSLTRLFSGRTQKVKIAFLNEKTGETSSWTYSHELGRLYLEETYPDNVETFHIDNIEEGESAEKAIEAAIAQGSDLIFTTSPCLIKSSVRAAVTHPNVIILNCSLNQFYHSLRTYYGRMYEAKFLMGAIAAAMSETDHIGYLADYPIYGTIANINAFAMGAKMINPRAMIHLEWSRINHWSGRHLSEMDEVQVISGQDMIRPDAPSREFGLYMKGKNGIENIASPIWHWGKFYEQIVQNVLDGTWKKTKTAMNYWLGLSSDVIDIVYSNSLPVGTRRLLKFLQASIIKNTLEPFYGVLYSQDGIVQKSEDESLTPEQIVTMDWLADNVLGVIPSFSDLTDEARELVLLQGPLNTEE